MQDNNYLLSNYILWESLLTTAYSRSFNITISAGAPVLAEQWYSLFQISSAFIRIDRDYNFLFFSTIFLT